jgi:hypothetical protein
MLQSRRNESGGIRAAYLRTALSLVCLAVVLLLRAMPAMGLEHVYRIVIADDLHTVTVEAQLAGGVTKLQARNGTTSRLEGLRTCDDMPLKARGNGIITSESDGCVRYSYPLRSSQRERMALPDDVVVSIPSEWLWLPSLAEEDRLRIELKVPTGLECSVPWVAAGPGVYYLEASPLSSRGAVIIGHFSQHDLDIPGGRLRVALIDSPDNPLEEINIIAWLRSSATDVAGVSGRFPNPQPQIIVQSGESRRDRRSRSAVPFGYVIRDGGETVRFYVDAGRPLDDYLGDWTATHEFSHLLLPYIASEQKWISEGFASYYQNVLLARRGVYTEENAWWRLVRSFRRAAEISRPPALNDISEHSFGKVRMLIYWSGAAIALMADTRLRELSGGSESLDTVLARLQECCLPSKRTWQGAEFFNQLDELSPYPIFAELYEKYAHRRGMPDMVEIYDDLGIKPGADGVILASQAKLAEVRRAIMSPTAAQSAL